MEDLSQKYSPETLLKMEATESKRVEGLLTVAQGLLIAVEGLRESNDQINQSFNRQIEIQKTLSKKKALAEKASAPAPIAD